MEDKSYDLYTWDLDALAIVIRYFLFAGIAYFIFYNPKRAMKNLVKIQISSPPSGIIGKEILYSCLTLFIYCAVSWCIFRWQQSGITRIYLDIYPRGYPYLMLSILLMVLLHDTYFYWTHRLLHLPKVFEVIHKTHHLSQNPTPWAAFSFHPVEAVISAGIVPLIVFIIPCHPLALFTFLTYMTVINVIGHLGFEIFPEFINHHKILRWQNTSTNHNWHHQKCRNNYGLYFTFWDRMMKTYHLRNK